MKTERKTQKCETILFRPNLAYANRDLRRNYKTFAIKENKNSDNIVTYKKCVRYLGIYKDETFKYNTHVETQLSNARRDFFINKRFIPSISIIK